MTDERPIFPKYMTDQFEKVLSSDAKVEVSDFISEKWVYWVDSSTVLLAPVTHRLYTLWKDSLTLLERELLK